MRVLSFRGCAYGVPVLALVCAKSPFGWGWTHPPLPQVNFLLSGVYYTVSILLGAMVLFDWARSSCARGLKWPAVGLLCAMIWGVAWRGLDSIHWQLTSAHYQYVGHQVTILVVLLISGGMLLARVVLLLALRQGTRRHAG